MPPSLVLSIKEVGDMEWMCDLNDYQSLPLEIQVPGSERIDYDFI
jgi:hypothetical protein